MRAPVVILCALLMLTGSAVSLCAQTAPAKPPVVNLGEHLWFADNGQRRALLAGPTAVWTLRPGWNLTGRRLSGMYQSEGDREDTVEWNIGLQGRWSVVYAEFGWTELAYDTDLKSGWVWTEGIPEEDERNADIYGPYIAVGAKTDLARPGITIVLRGVWLAKDYGPFEDLDRDGSFIETELGLYTGRRRWRAGLGYRRREYADLPPRISNESAYDRNTQNGLFGELSIRF